MTFVIGYLAVGVVIMIVPYVSHRLKQTDHTLQEESLSEIMERCSQPRSVPRKIMHCVSAYIFLGCLLLPLWPGLIVLKLLDLFRNPTKPAEGEKVFCVTKQDLLQALSIEQIEMREHVTDPMGAVPDIPFGHLHASWQVFKTSIMPDDVLYSFSAIWTKEWGGKRLHEGYVILREGQIGPHFLTSMQKADTE